MSYLPQYNSGSQYGSQNKVQPKPSSPNGVQPKPTSWTGQGQQDVPYTGGHYNQQVPRQYAQQQPDSLLPQQPQQQQQRPGFSLNTSIQPQNVYPQQYTNQAANLAATNVPAYNDLVAGRQRPGVSVQSPMTQAGMGADIGSALAQAMMARSGVQQQHGFANAQNQLGGQTARDQEARGLMQLYMGNLGAAQNQGLMQDQGLLQLLSTIFGMA